MNKYTNNKIDKQSTNVHAGTFFCIPVKLFILIFISLLNGCSMMNEKSSADSVKVPSQFVPLIAVPETLQNRVWLEKFSFATSAGKTLQSMLLQTELSSAMINIAAMSFEGIPLAQASWKAQGQIVESKQSAANTFDAKQVLHDLQLVHWPIDKIAPVLSKGFSVDEQLALDESTGENSDKSKEASSGKKIKTRRFYHHGEEIIIIRYQVEDIVFKQLNKGYLLTIKRLSDLPLEKTSH